MDKSARRFLDADGRVLVLRNQEKDSLLYNTSIYYETNNLNAAKAEIVDAPGIKNTKALHFIIKEPNVIKDSIKKSRIQIHFGGRPGFKSFVSENDPVNKKGTTFRIRIGLQKKKGASPFCS